MLSTKQVARELNIAENTVRQLIATGRLPAVRIGKVFRVQAESVQEYLAERVVVRR